jgi:hypothetical protein
VALDEYNDFSIPESTADIIPEALLYSAGNIEEPTNDLTISDLEHSSEVTILKSIAPQAETVFLEGQPEVYSTNPILYQGVGSLEKFPSYPVLFLLYLTCVARLGKFVLK